MHADAIEAGGEHRHKIRAIAERACAFIAPGRRLVKANDAEVAFGCTAIVGSLFLPHITGGTHTIGIKSVTKDSHDIYSSLALVDNNSHRQMHAAWRIRKFLLAVKLFLGSGSTAFSVPL